MSFDLFVARRIFKSKSGSETFSRPAIIIATAGIAVGIIVMILSVSIVFGFKHEVSSKVVGFSSHIQILSQTQSEDHEILPVNTDSSTINIVKHTPYISEYHPFANKTGMIKTEDDFKGVLIKGVGEDYNLDFFTKYLVKGVIPQFSSHKSNNSVLLSQIIASEMKINVGDKVCMYFFDMSNGNIRARKFNVSGIYDTHLEEFDKQICLTDIYTVRKLNKWNDEESTGVEIVLNDVNHVNESMDYLISNINHTFDKKGCVRCAYSVYDLSPHIFSWLDILDMNVVMILVLMLVIGGFTVMAGLLIVMLDRIQMIGILKALGSTNLTIRRIFSNFAIMIVGKGIIIGDIIGIGLCFLQESFSIVKLNPDTYYIDTVPIDINWIYIILINVGVLIISSLVIFGSSFLMSIKGPASTMKWD